MVVEAPAVELLFESTFRLCPPGEPFVGLAPVAKVRRDDDPQITVRRRVGEVHDLVLGRWSFHQGLRELRQ